MHTQGERAIKEAFVAWSESTISPGDNVSYITQNADNYGFSGENVNRNVSYITH